MRFLLIVVLAIISAGCKITIQTPKEGYVTTVKGSFRCPGAQSCTIDVTDFYFDETFVGHPNIETMHSFVGWKAADLHLCGGLTTSCKLSLTDVKPTEALISLIESDFEVFLSPVFESRLGDSKLEYRQTNDPRVIDNTGKVIGSMQYRSYHTADYTGPWSIDVNFKWLHYPYTLRIDYHDTGEGLMRATVPVAPRYTGTSCDEKSGPVNDDIFHGADDYIHVGPDNVAYIHSSALILPPGTPTGLAGRARSEWDPTTGECIAVNSQEEWLHHLKKTNLTWEYPLRIEGTDLTIPEWKTP